MSVSRWDTICEPTEAKLRPDCGSKEVSPCGGERAPAALWCELTEPTGEKSVSQWGKVSGGDRSDPPEPTGKTTSCEPVYISLRSVLDMCHWHIAPEAKLRIGCGLKEK